MPDDNSTPEKELLRLIEGQKGPGGGPAPRLGKGPRPSLSFGALRGLLMGRLSFFRRSAGRRISSGGGAKGFGFRTANQLLGLVVLALVSYLAADAGASAVQLSRPVQLSAPKENPAAAAARGGDASPLNESAYYLQKVSARDIFKEGGRPEPKETAEASPVAVEDNPATSGLSLVGISWSANPDVIIEDKERKRTYFVKRGQNVGDGVKVEAIFKDHVVLSYEGREFELR